MSMIYEAGENCQARIGYESYDCVPHSDRVGVVLNLESELEHFSDSFAFALCIRLIFSTRSKRLSSGSLCALLQGYDSRVVWYVGMCMRVGEIPWKRKHVGSMLMKGGKDRMQGGRAYDPCSSSICEKG